MNEWVGIAVNGTIHTISH